MFILSCDGTIVFVGLPMTEIAARLSLLRVEELFDVRIQLNETLQQVSKRVRRGLRVSYDLRLGVLCFSMFCDSEFCNFGLRLGVLFKMSCVFIIPQ